MLVQWICSYSTFFILAHRGNASTLFVYDSIVSLLGVYLGISNMHVTGNTQLGELPLTMVTNFFVFLTCANAVGLTLQLCSEN